MLRCGRIVAILLLQVLLLLSLALPLWSAEDPFVEDDPFADDEATAEIADPLEGLNRGIFWFNDKLYFYLLKPVARVWRVVPEPGRESVDNFFANIATPIRFTNNLLQLKGDRALEELGRFVFNSTIGIAGLFDPADSWLGLRQRPEDTGQTLGHYGVGQGFYLVLPLLGPSSARDGVGRVGDYFLDPWTYVDITYLEAAGIRTFDLVNELSLDKDTYEGIKRDALDPYLFIRGAYVQHRASKVKE